MAWETSDRKSRLPSDWLKRRSEVFKIHGRRCYIFEDGRQCTNEAEDIDHVIPGDDDSLENLRPICRRCHRAKSSSEGWQALNKKKKEARERAEKRFGWAEERPVPATPYKHPWMA